VAWIATGFVALVFILLIVMYDVVVEGAPRYQTRPLLQVDHVSVGVPIVSLCPGSRI
jgi:hypothetical protein